MNRDELASLVQGHQAQVYRYLRFLGAAHEVAQDLAQETFVAAFQKNLQGQWGQTANPAAWLRGVARNLFLAQCRRAKANPVHLDSDSVERAEAVWAGAFPGSEDGSEYLAALRQCVAGLPARQREMVELQYGQAKSRAEMAAAQGLTEDGVKTLMRRLRAQLAECVERRLRNGGAA